MGHPTSGWSPADIVRAVTVGMVLAALSGAALGQFDPSRVRVTARIVSFGHSAGWADVTGDRLLHPAGDGGLALMMSKNRGRDWQVVLDARCRPIASRKTAGRVWCASSSGALYVSNDAGDTWQSQPLGPVPAGFYGFDWIDDTTWIVRAFPGNTLVWKISRNSGATYADLPTAGLPADQSFSSIFHSVNDSVYATVQVAQAVAIFRLRPEAAAWETVATNAPIVSDIFESASGSWYSNRMVSRDFGATWKPVPIPSVPQSTLLLSIYPFDDNRLNLLTYSYAHSEYSFLTSDNGGISWSPVNTQQEIDTFVWKVAINPANPSQWLSFDPGGARVSTDAGNTWQQTWRSANQGLFDLPEKAWWLGDQGEAILGRLGNVLVRGNGGVDAFAPVSYFNSTTPVSPTLLYDVVRTADGTLFLDAAGPAVALPTVSTRLPGVDVYASRDAGSTWSVVNRETVGIFSIETLFRATAKTLWLNSLTTTYRSFDGGRSWSQVAPDFQPSQTLQTGAHVAVAFGTAGGARLMVARDDEAAVTFIPVTDPTIRGYGIQLLVDPYRDDVFYATAPSAGAIMRSLDGGRTWRRFAPYIGGDTTLNDAMRTIDGRLFTLRSRRDYMHDLRITYLVPAFAADVAVVEFRNAVLGHYFMTASAAEAAGIDAGAAGPGWSRTGSTWRLWSQPGAGALPVHRFYASGPNSHFFTIDLVEAAFLRKLEGDQRAAAPAATFAGWHYEGIAYGASPAQDGSCVAPNVPLFRMYNNRATQNDSNHRFTTDTTTRDATLAQGWRDEGVAMCVQR